MKQLHWVWMVFVLVLTGAVAAEDPEWSEAPALRGPHHAVWQKVFSEALPDGRTLYRTNSFTTLTTGMHAWDGKTWVPADTRIEPVPGGAVGHYTAHKIAFAANLNTPSAIQIQAPDGKKFSLNLLGLAFTDYASGHSELFASVKDSFGFIVGNEIWYPQAFEGASASVRWVHTLAGCDQDIVLEGALPSPADFHCDPETTRVEVWTAFSEWGIDPIRKVTILSGEPDPAKRQRMVDPDLTDETLDFGWMRMDLGQAYVIDPSAPDGEGTALAPCGKSWIRADNRQFLVEKIEYRLLRDELRKLPQGAAIPAKPNQALMAAASVKGTIARPFPKAPSLKIGATQAAMVVAAAKPRTPGIILDFTLLSSATNFVFSGNSTYFVTNGTVSFSQTSVIEPGTCVKFSRQPAINRLLFNGPIDCRTGPGKPAFFVGQDEDSIGEKLPWSSGAPSTNTYASRAIDLNDSSSAFDLHDLHIRNADKAIYINGGSLNLSHSQLGRGTYGIYANDKAAKLRNVLLYDLLQAFAHGVTTNSMSGEHLTLHRIGTLINLTDTNYLRLTNCLVISVTNGTTVFTGSNDVKVVTSDTGIFATVGAGAHYLADDTYRVAGSTTTNINPALATALKRRTTYPPVVLSGPISISTNFGFQAKRDDDGIYDGGFHYDPIDIAVSQIDITNCTVGLLPGVVVGVYGASGTYGLRLVEGATLIGQGHPTNFVQITRYNMVQEQSVTNWSAASIGKSISLSDYLPTPDPRASFRYVEFCVPAGGQEHVDEEHLASGAILKEADFRDCQFYAGKLTFYNANMTLSNSLLEQVDLSIYSFTSRVHNCTFVSGSWTVDGTIGEHHATDNIFDKTYFNPLASGVISDYNGYLTNYSRMSPTGTHDQVVTTLTYQTGPAGYVYMPTNSPFIDKGSVSDAGQVGLYHFTSFTNQVKEAHSQLNLGFHFVALGTNGLPADTDGDGLSDVEEDVNGDGYVASLERNWLVYDSIQTAITMAFGIWRTQIPTTRGTPNWCACSTCVLIPTRSQARWESPLWLT